MSIIADGKGITSMTWAEIVIAFATVSGPIFAIQIQKYLESWREIRARRLQVFRILMATRATIVAPEHVHALNSIPGVVSNGVFSGFDFERIAD